jgi:Flp pilus assembly protein protease CpaA
MAWFLFYLFLIGILIGICQDFKRREVDNWLNYALLVFSFAFIFFQAIFNWSFYIILLGFFCLIIMFLLGNLFYYGRVFAGGDAKLLIAMAVFFIGTGFLSSLINIGVFILFLFLSGSIYGLVYSFVLFIGNFKSCSLEFKKQINKSYFKYLFLVGLILFVFSYVSFLFLLPGVFILVGSFLFIFAKSIENVVMIKSVFIRDLREGDWLVKNVKVGRKVIKSDWEGLEKKDLNLLMKVSGKRKIKIKDGIPFTPAFLFAFLSYVFFSARILSFLSTLFVL